MAEIPYEIAAGDPRKAPKGKVPWIDDDGHVLGDSAFIIQYLKQKHGDLIKIWLRLMTTYIPWKWSWESPGERPLLIWKWPLIMIQSRLKVAGAFFTMQLN